MRSPRTRLVVGEGLDYVRGMQVRPLPGEAIICASVERRAYAGLDRAMLNASGELWQPAFRAMLATLLIETAPQLSATREAVLGQLAQTSTCVVRGFDFLDADGAAHLPFMVAFTSLLGELSTNDAYAADGRDVVGIVAPTDPTSADVTYSLGECEPHADETSKPTPEDVVLLWCVRPASAGGASLVWPVSDLLAAMSTTAGGRDAISTLRECRFPFGGRLRRPPRVLWAPILVGERGIRYRLGSIRDGYESLGIVPSEAERHALDELAGAIRTSQPYQYELRKGELLVIANRKSLHARTHFVDYSRVLMKTRAHAHALRPGDEENVRWHQG